MKISLATVGKTETKALQDSVLEYTKRIQRYTTFDFIETTEEKMEKNLEKFDRVYLLDEKGKEYTSPELASFIERQLNMGLKSVAFIIGGPFGFSEKIRDMADGEIALSKMTFPHDLVRVIFLEQLYRAFSILKNEKYHHE